MLRLASNRLRRCKLTNISLVLGLMFVLYACGGDNDVKPSGGYNIIANSPNAQRMGETSIASKGSVVKMGSIQAASEGSVDLRYVAARMEIPRLQGGDRNLFLVHTLSDGSVNYCVEWNYNLRAQYWSAFRWDNTNSDGSAGYSGEFAEDPLIPSEYRTTLEDHRSNGHDRGHIVASADRQHTKEANRQTFYLRNMQPQLNGFNTNDKKSDWYNLEIRLRDKYNKDGFRDTLYVVKGGTISAGMYSTAKGLPVPKYFFMAVLCKKKSNPSLGGYKAIGFWMEHKTNTYTNNIKDYAVSIDRLEELTGLDLFCNLPDNLEEQVEKSLVLSLW